MEPEENPPPPVPALLPELWQRVAFYAPSVEVIGNLACVSKLFHSALLEEVLRDRSAAQGHPVLEAATLPVGETSWVQFLCWGERRRRNRHGAVASCASQNVLVDPHGTVWTFGSGSLIPRRVASLASVCVTRVSTGSVHSLALASDGTAYSWGGGGGGGFDQLGHGDAAVRHTPTKIEALHEEHVVELAAGEYHSLAVAYNGATFSWGHGSSGPLGHGNQENRHTPTRVDALREVRVVGVAAGGSKSLAVAYDGTAHSWGHGGFGQLGHGDEGSRYVPMRIEALQGLRVVAMGASIYTSFAVTCDGAAYSWGDGACGQLGHGDEGHRCVPTRIEALQGVRVIAVAAAQRKTIALAEDRLTGRRAVYSWGYGHGGQLGLGDVENRQQPTRIQALSGVHVVAIAAGGYCGLAMADDGSSYSWGQGHIPGPNFCRHNTPVQLVFNPVCS